MTSQPVEFSFSNVLSNTFGVIGRHPAVFLGLSLVIVSLPQLLVQTAVGPWSEDPTQIFTSSGSIVGTGIGYLVFIFLSVILQASLIVASANDLSGKPVNFGDCVGRAVAKLLPLIGMGIVIAFGCAIGFIFLIVPGVILYLMWMVAVPALVVENLGVFEALSRSSALTSGSRLKLFGLIIIFVIFTFVVALPFGMLAFISASLGMLTGALLNAVTAAVSAAGIAAVYIELRGTKEGTSSDQLASIFG